MYNNIQYIRNRNYQFDENMSINSAALSTLNVIDMNQGDNCLELSQRMVISKSAVSQTVKKLETLGLREKTSKKYADLTYFERLKHICEVPYMGAPVLESGNVICVNAVNYGVSGKYCCAGHFLHHYKIMLGINLSVMDIVSSPLDNEGSMPCVIRFHID